MESATHERSRRRQVVVYAALMTVLGLAAFVITLLATDSLWWALLALLVAGPVARVVLGALGLDPGPPQPRAAHPAVPGDRGDVSSEGARSKQ